MRCRGFTLVEIVVVIAVLLVLAALTIGIAGMIPRKANVSQAREEIRAMRDDGLMGS